METASPISVTCDSVTCSWHSQPAMEHGKAKARLGLHQPGVTPLGSKLILAMNYSEGPWDLFLFVSPLSLPFILEEEPLSQSPARPHPPTPHTDTSYCIPKKITSIRPGKALLCSFCIYIVHYSGSWVEERVLLCIFVLAIVYAGLTE